LFPFSNLWKKEKPKLMAIFVIAISLGFDSPLQRGADINMVL